MADLECLLEYSEIVSKVFANEDDGFEFYNAYALGKGFSVRKSYVEWNSDHTERTLRRYVFSRQGYREEKYVKNENKKRRPRDITRVGCPAKLVIAVDQNTGQWYVKNFIDEHNHPRAPPDLGCLLRSHRKISDDQKAEIVELGVAGIRKHQIFEIMEMQYGGYDKVGYTSRDLYNFCYLHKVEIIDAGDAQTVMSHLRERQNRDSDFYYKYMTDEKGHLKGMFWCDTQCLLDYTAFGDVVVSDSTYKTNRYNLPLVPFVGVNHHYRTVIFGCGIIAHEDIESFVWLLKTFTEANVQKHPVSVITDGDLAMQRAIKVVWPNSPHRLCGWHIEQNLVRNVKNDTVKAAFWNFMYDRCSIEEIERKWQAFLVTPEVTEESWVHQMYEVRETWCAAYHAGHCYLGLRSNQQSESMNSRFQMKLDGKMTMLEMVQHYESCLTKVRRNEVDDDAKALQSEPFTEPDASILEINAKRRFTPNIFRVVQFSVKAAKKCYLVEILDGDDTAEYIIGRSDRDIMYYMKCELSEGSNLKAISCSCLKLQSLGTPCSHIFFVLGHLNQSVLPDCCVWERWTMCAKRAFPPIRKSTMYDYSPTLLRYRELRNLSRAAAFSASRSTEAYERFKGVLEHEAAAIMPNAGANEGNMYGPVLPQAEEDDCEEFRDVLDPMHVPGRGAPKKKLKSSSATTKSTSKFTLCKEEGHNRRCCPLRAEETKLPEDVLDF